MLMGWSSGGIIAVEMARLLEDRCIKVSSVVLLDAVPPECAAQTPETISEAEMCRLVATHIGVDGVPGQAKTIEAFTEWIQTVHPTAGVPAPRELRAMMASYNATGRMLAGYRSPLIEADIVLYSASTGETARVDRRGFWQSRTSGQVSELKVLADHDAMLTPSAIAQYAGDLYHRLAEKGSTSRA